MIDKNIVLVGFMGAGKSATAEVLAVKLGFKRVSTDEMIVEQEGRAINDIFETDGEQYFRDCETRMIYDIAQLRRLVVDCGGGVVLKDENLAILKQHGVIVYLQTSPDVIYERVKHDTHRPLLNVEDPIKAINDLLSERVACYAKADYIVVTDNKTAGEVAEEIIEILNRH